LRAAAILGKRHIYVFDLDSEPASCNVYPLLPRDNFKVLLPKQPGKKQTSIITAEETQLTEEQIQNIAAEFGQHATTAQELFKMKRQMSHDDFRGWVNAVGYLQMLQNAFAYDIVEKSGSLWKQAIVQKYI